MQHSSVSTALNLQITGVWLNFVVNKGVFLFTPLNINMILIRRING